MNYLRRQLTAMGVKSVQITMPQIRLTSDQKVGHMLSMAPGLVKPEAFDGS